MANEDQNNNNNEDFQRGLLLDTKPKTKKPSMSVSYTHLTLPTTPYV